MKKYGKLLTASALALSTGLVANANNVLSLQANKPGAAIQPTMYGLFFEDINYAADGGLYAEMVKNRSFEFPQNLQGWVTFGGVELRDDGPFERNPHYVRLTPASHAHKHSGIENEGFFGVAVKKGEEYRFSVWARVSDGGTAKLKVVIADTKSQEESQNIATAHLTVDSKEWKKYTAVLKPKFTEAKGKLRIFLERPETTVDLEHVSLFPADTWNGHENGLRRDLAQKLADLKPGVFRFPGGCIVEGTEIYDRYQWKNTVGPVENRPTNANRWHYTFTNRFYPDYYQSGGLGFYEYFLLSEEIGAEPLPVLNVGLVCQYQNDKPEAHVPVDQLDPYIQDALDLIEFANGPVDSEWGKLRADMGHPAPFDLKFIAIGNEQWGPEYVERLQPFVAAIRKAYPDIKIIGSSGPNSEGKDFDYLWPEMRRLKADWFLSQGARYDNYDRKGPKVFAGEYACHIKKKKWNHFYPALLEAAFMTGLERNADVVHMATYAPLFAHVEGWQWRPDMIWFDNLRSMPTASYYVQQLYAKNKGTQVVPLTMDKKPLTGAEGQNGLFASAVWDADTSQYIVKIANTSDEPQQITLNFDGLKKNQTVSGGTLTTLISDDLDAENTLDNPDLIRPVESPLAVSGRTFSTTVAPTSFAVLRFNLATPAK